QMPVFDGAPVENWKSHPVFKPHYNETGPVPRLYSSGNLTIGRKVLSEMPQPFLDLAFNFTGGGDTDFIARAMDRGFRTAWAAHAIVRETVPENRVSWDWIQKRALRNGELSARIEHRTRARQGTGRARTWLHTGLLALAAPLRFLARLARTGSLLNALYPVHIALGRIMSEFGYKNEQYRNPRD
ncbi:MAG: glycosyltransferase family 2 protein, partial [Pseudomonadota bacterium]